MILGPHRIELGADDPRCPLKAVFLFNKTLSAPQPWLDRGYECWIFDGQLQPGIHRKGSLVRVGMWFDADRQAEQVEEVAAMVGHGVQFIASFAECTFLAVSGARWLYHPDDKHLPTAERRPHPGYPNRRKDRADAVVLAKMAEALAVRCGTTCWMLENPAGSMLSTLWRKSDYRFDPYEYGGYLPENSLHPEYPDHYPANDAYRKATGIWCGAGFKMPPCRKVEPKEGGFHDITKLGGKSLRTKNIRSYTPRGFALAVALANTGEQNGEKQSNARR